MKNRSIGCVIPTLNSAETLEMALLSLRLQSRVASHTLVADSGSTDGTLELCCKWNVPTTYVEPGNIYDAINAGLENIDTEWLTYLNSDDWLYSDSLSRLIELGESSGADAVYGDCDYFDSQGRFVYSFTAAEPLQLMPLFRLARMGFAQPATIFRRSLYQRLNGFDTRYRFKADADFFIRALKSGARLIRLAGPSVACFRLHPEQLSNRKSEEIEAEGKQLFENPDGAGILSDRLVLAQWRLKNLPNYLIRILRESLLSERLRFPRSIESYFHQ